MVVNERDERQYDDIASGTLVFSPDSKRVAYGARLDDKWFVVVNGKDGKQYDDIVAVGGGDVTGIHLWGGGAMAKIDVEVVAGGTLQITLAGSNASGEIDTAWFAL